MRRRQISKELFATTHQKDPYHILGYAVLTQAVNDLIESYFTIMVTDLPGQCETDKRRDERRTAERHIRDTESFFRGEWYPFLASTIGFAGEGEWMIRMCAKRAEEYLVCWMNLRGKQQTNYNGTHKKH